MMKMSFRDPVTGKLKACGFMQTNELGDIAQAESDDFSLLPQQGWQWDGAKWIAYAPPLTTAQAITANERAIQSALDAKAQERGYRSIDSACSYAASSQVIPSNDPTFATCEKFRLEGNALKAWKMRTWATAYAYLATVEAGTNPMPSPSQAVAMMPVFTWPD